MADRRKILLATFDGVPEPTGSSVRLTELLRGLTPAFNLEVLTPKSEGHAHLERYFGARLMRVPMLKKDLPTRVQTFERAVRRQLESDDYELVHVTDPFAGYPACQRRGAGGPRIVYDAHSLPSLELQLTQPELLCQLRFAVRLRRLERYCLLSADLVLASSESFKATLCALGVPPERVRIVPPPVDLTRFRPSSVPPQGDALRLVYLGSGAPWEGCETLLKALRKALEQDVRVKLRIAGPLDAANARALRSLVADLGLSDAVALSGPVDHAEVPRLLAEAHASVAPFAAPPSVGPIGRESLKVAECLAAGRPLLLADSPLHRELVGNSRSCLFFRPNDPDDLADRMGTLALGREALEDLGRRAAARAIEAFDGRLARQALLRAYYELLDPTVVVGLDGPAVSERTGGRTGDGSSSSAPLAAIGAPAREPDTRPGAPTDPAVEPVAPDREPTPIAPPPEPQVHAPEDRDWFSAFLPKPQR